MRELDDITGGIVDASLRIHRDLGPGLLESVYEAVLARALHQRGVQVERQQVICFACDGMVFEEGFRTDLLVDNRVSAPPREPGRWAVAVPRAIPLFLAQRRDHIHPE